ncbi:restriction endonuclease subunit S, partial [Thiolapillus sp.]|uniref:restriction endonuclease subunit S n=1 Tax=Thiolapillus sp. TaxID=2017437 RepID=UPI0025F7366C
IQEHGYQGIRKDDLVIHAMDAFAGAIGVSDSEGKATPVYAACVGRGEFKTNSQYFAYLLRFISKAGYILALAKGIRERSTDFRFNDFGKLLLPLPPKAEQDRIANFLDQKTAEIDEAIAKKQRLIELLKEQKAILINQAVTKGLNPDVAMRDSGVEWIGEVPVHWTVQRAKFLFREIDKRSETGEEELLSVSHMTGVTPRSEKNNVYMFMAEDYSGSKLCHKDDLVFNIMWAWMGAVGVSDRTGIVSPSYGVYRQKKSGTFNSWYLENLLRSGQYVAEYNRRSTGLHSSRLRLYPDMFFDMEIGFPPKIEQDVIESTVGERTSEIDAALKAVETEIETISEYRNVIITEAVTGKIKL